LQTFTGGVNGKWATYADIDYRPTVSAGNVENFSKEGSANFKKIYFLVLSGTASASELVINNLQGVMNTDVKLIGRKTYGKPVGFFAINIDQLDLYVPQFETKNQKNVGGYYAGLTVDKDLFDDVTKDFGDEKESLLAAALSYSEKGTFSVSSKGNTLSSLSGMSVIQERILNDALEDRNSFNGMVDDTRKKLKIK
jgi:carboxyl-terminal processing protease